MVACGAGISSSTVFAIASLKEIEKKEFIGCISGSKAASFGNDASPGIVEIIVQLLQ